MSNRPFPVSPQQERIILGIDPGLALVGIGILRTSQNTCELLTCDVIRTQAKDPLSRRLQTIYRGLEQFLARYQPDVAAIEGLFWGTNVTNAINVGAARGVIFLALASCGIPIVEYAPSKVKAVVAGNGQAKKREVGEVIRAHFHLAAVPKPDDAVDGVAAAVCHWVVDTQHAERLLVPPSGPDAAAQREREEKAQEIRG